MRKVLAILTSALCCAASYAQGTLTLEQAVSIAMEQSFDAQTGEADYQSGLWVFESFSSSLKPHLEFNLNPNYLKETSDSKFNYLITREYDMLSAAAELRLSDRVSALGGDFYLSSYGLWTQYFRQMYDVPRLFAMTPLKVGYKQDLLGFNPYKWDIRIENTRMDYARDEHSFEMRKVALTAARLYLEALRTENLYKMHLNNANTSEVLFNIGREKFRIASIRNDELSSLELQWKNAVNRCSITETEMLRAHEELYSYLGIESERSLEIPQPEFSGNVNADKVHELVNSNNPVFTRNALEVLKTMKEEERSRKEIGLQSSIDINLGVQNYSPAIMPTMSDASLFSVSGINITIPIIDQKTARDKHKAAQYKVEAANARSMEEQRSLMVEVNCTIRDFEQYRQLLQQAADVVILADEAYRQANDNYANGIADINSFAIAQTRREAAYENYYNILTCCWVSYYKLSMLCGCDDWKY